MLRHSIYPIYALISEKHPVPRIWLARILAVSRDSSSIISSLSCYPVTTCFLPVNSLVPFPSPPYPPPSPPHVPFTVLLPSISSPVAVSTDSSSVRSLSRSSLGFLPFVAASIPLVLFPIHHTLPPHSPPLVSPPVSSLVAVLAVAPPLSPI